MSEADLSEANLFGADLKVAVLERADLRDAVLRGADLSFAILGQSNLSGANLWQAVLRKAFLDGADLSEVKLYETVMADTYMRGAIGLGSCRHDGPSTLDHRTLINSGDLPQVFLRGCGLPDDLIDYLPSLLGKAVQFYSCFISYSTDDQEFADRLYADLQNKGVRCWFAPHDMRPGKKIHEQIDDAIRVYDKLLLILSGASMESEWVKTEISKARKREVQEKRRMLFPLRLIDLDTLRSWECFDSDTGKDSAREIREYFIPDFSRWKSSHDAYKGAFDGLLKALSPEKRATA